MPEMTYGTIPGLEKPISRLVQGITVIQTREEKVGFGQLDDAFAAGINCVDTAYIYGNCDEFLGKWMKSRGNRDRIVVLAKCAHHTYRKRVTPYDILTELHDILARMQTDYVDLLVLHRDDPDYPVEPIVDVLNHCVRAGTVRAFGGSNWTHPRLEAANDYARRSGQIPFAVSSPNFSLARQLKEPWADCVTISGPDNEEARQWYAGSGMALFPWSSMAGGFLSGRYRRDNLAPLAEGLQQLIVDCYASEDNFVRLDRAQSLAEAKGLSLPQIALAYVLNYPLNIHPLVAAANADEIAANLVALHTKLTPQERAYLDLRADAPT